MTDDIERFVKEIKPALVVESESMSSHASRQYGEAKNEIKCPRCGDELVFEDRAYRCGNGHGILISGKVMIAIRSEGVKKYKVESSSPVKHPQIQCPNCQSKMALSNYQNTEIEIDICTHCGYRWIDNGEEVILYG